MEKKPAKAKKSSAIAGLSKTKLRAYLLSHITNWFAVGAVLVLGTISLGFPVVLVGLAGALLLLSRPAARGSALGLFAGAGAVCVLVAALNWTSRSGGYLNPIPWLVAGAVLISVPVLYFWKGPDPTRNYAGKRR